MLYTLTFLNAKGKTLSARVEGNNSSFTQQPTRYVIIDVLDVSEPNRTYSLFKLSLTKEDLERLMPVVRLSDADIVTLPTVQHLISADPLSPSSYPRLTECFQHFNSSYQQTTIAFEICKGPQSDQQKWKEAFDKGNPNDPDELVAKLNSLHQSVRLLSAPSNHLGSHPNPIPTPNNTASFPNNPTSKNTTTNQKKPLQLIQPSTRPDLLAQENSKLKETLAEHATRIDVLEGNLAKQFNTIRQCEIAIERLQKMYEQTQATLEKIVGTDSTDPMGMLSTISAARARLVNSCDTSHADTDDSHLGPSSNHLDPNNNNNTANENSRKRSSDTEKEQWKSQSRKKIKLFDIDLNSNPIEEQESYPNQSI